MTRKALGRGLSALIPSATPLPTAPTNPEGGPLRVRIDRIRANHLQPRKHFDPETLSELAASIQKHGLAQPIIVSFDPGTRSYELIAGERRLRAAQLAGMTEIDVVVRQPNDDKHRLALTLIENLQRSDLNPIEVGLGYLRLMKEFGINQTELADEVAKSKAAISNTLRLLELPDEIQKALQFAQISEGHGRALLMIEDPSVRLDVFHRIAAERLSVRDVESLARLPESVVVEKNKKITPQKSADLQSLEESIQQSLGTKVQIRTRKDPAKGEIVISFFSFSDFERIIGKIK